MAATTSGERVLIVEDEPSTRLGLTELVRTWGFTTDSAADGEEALQRITVFRPTIIISDLVMPRMSGRELGQEIARRFPGLPVLFMSGYTGEDVRSRGLLEGSAPFVQKPFTPEALARRVRTLLDGNMAGDAAALTGSC